MRFSEEKVATPTGFEPATLRLEGNLRFEISESDQYLGGKMMRRYHIILTTMPPAGSVRAPFAQSWQVLQRDHPAQPAGTHQRHGTLPSAVRRCAS